MKITVRRGLVITAGVLATTAFAQVLPEKPNTVWFQSWMAWATFALVICDIIARFFGLYRLGAGGFKKALNEQTAHFDEKLQQVESRLEMKFNGFTAGAESRMNGFGSRVADMESDQTGLNAKQTALDSRMASSEMDRAHINKKLDDIARAQETILALFLNQKR